MATVDKQQTRETIKKAVEQAKQKPKKEEPKAPEKKEDKSQEESKSKKDPPKGEEATLAALVEDTIIKQDTAKAPKLEELLPKYRPQDSAQKKDYQPAQEAQRPPQDAYQRPGENKSPAHAYDPKNQAYENNPGHSYKAGQEEKKRDHPHNDPLAQIIEGYKR